MLFTIQTYIEDYLKKRNVDDPDGYAVRAANLYYYHRVTLETEDFSRRMRRIRTLLFINNGIESRAEFEDELLARLDARFKKKIFSNNPGFPGGVSSEVRRLKHLRRITIQSLITEFKRAVEARGIDIFWESRARGKLHRRPEKIAQALLAVFSKGVISETGIVLREVSSGTGFVDVGIIMSSSLHLIEMKVLTGSFTGPSQLADYMRIEGRTRGHLVVIDALPPNKKSVLPKKLVVPFGAISIWPVNINPIAPSRTK